MPTREGIGLLQAQLQLLLDKLPDSQPDKMEFSSGRPCRTGPRA